MTLLNKTTLFFLLTFCFFTSALSLPSKDEILIIQDNDRVLGCDEAPYNLIEYSSLSCVHCGKFHNDYFSDIKKKFIDTCKVKYIYRDFPTTMSSLIGPVVAHCVAGDDDERFFELLFVMFQTQTSWVFQQDYSDSLLAILKLYGVKEDQFKMCLKNRDISSFITKRSFEAGKIFDIQYTPTFILNGKKIEGEIDLERLSKEIENTNK